MAQRRPIVARRPVALHSAPAAMNSDNASQPALQNANFPGSTRLVAESRPDFQWHATCTGFPHDDGIDVPVAASGPEEIAKMFERIHSETGRIRLHLRGALDGEGAEQMRDAITALATAEAHEIIIDLSNVTFIDGSGIGVLSYLFKRLTARGHRLCVVGASGQPLAMLRHLGLARLFDLPRNAPRRPFFRLAGLAWAR